MIETTSRATRHGVFTFYSKDAFVGLSLASYGEYSEGEVALFRKVLRPGDVALDVGAKIGALTVPMARIVGERGKVIAIEAQPENAELLRTNIKQNHLGNVEVHNCAAGSKRGAARMLTLGNLDHTNYGRLEVGEKGRPVQVHTIDSLLDPALPIRLIKIDVEGFEAEALRGARRTIEKWRPFLYVENDRNEKATELAGLLLDLGYRLWWHRPPLFTEENFDGNPVNVWGRQIVSLNLFCTDEAIDVDVSGAEEIVDNLDDAGSYDRVIERRMRRLAKRPEDLDTRADAAYLQVMLHRDAEAEAMFAENLARDPEHKLTKYVSSIIHFQRGDYVTAWPLWELRYSLKGTEVWGNRPHAGERWGGQRTEAPLLIWNEQGFGDQIMFARFIPEALRRAPNAFVEVQPALYELFESSGLVPRERLFRTGRTLPRYDYHCAIPSLAHALGVGNDVGMSSPYFRADEAMLATWRKKVVGNVGVCWQGSPKSERAGTRNIAVELLAPLTETRKFTSLVQRGQFDGFADTAACIEALDLVITVDTSVAHLAGALGKEVWLLLAYDSDWRWVRGESRSRWYPTMRIFAQRAFRQWEPVIAEVKAALDERESYARAAE